MPNMPRRFPNRGRTIVLFIMAAAGVLAAACRDATAERDWLHGEFRRGRAIFSLALREELNRRPDRAELTPAETAKVLQAGTLYPRLYGVLVNIYYQKEEPVFEALREDGSPEARREFAARYRGLVGFAARQFVECLFLAGPNADYIRSIQAAFEGKDRVDLVMLSTGYHARLDLPGEPVKPVELSPEFDRQWGLDAARFREAHGLTRGEGVRVAVLDSGIDSGHPIFRETDLGEHFVLVGRDGPPWTATAPMVDWGWHGTIVSSIVARYAPGVRLTVYKGMDSETMNNAPYPTILGHCMAAAIYKAVHDGNDVINISAGLGTDLPYVREACQYAWDNNVLIVTASPYYLGRYMGYHANYPGGYPTTVSVTGIDRREDGAYGYWPIAAPESTTTVAAPCAPFVAFPRYVPETDEYAPGISCATPIAAAAVALIMSQYPRTGSEPPGRYCEAVKRLLIESADPERLGYPGFTPECGYGLVDALAGVRAAQRANAQRQTGGLP